MPHTTNDHVETHYGTFLHGAFQFSIINIQLLIANYIHIQLTIQNRVNAPKAISMTLVVLRIFIVVFPRFWL